MTWFFRRKPPAPETGKAAAPTPARDHAAASILPATPDPAVEIEPLLADLREAARRAGIQRDDPMMPLLTAFAQQIRFLATRNAQSEQVAQATSQKILNALTQARQTADSEIARFREGIAATESDTIGYVHEFWPTCADQSWPTFR